MKKRRKDQGINENINFLILTLVIVSIVTLVSLTAIQVNVGRVIASLDGMEGIGGAGGSGSDEEGTIGGIEVPLPNYIAGIHANGADRGERALTVKTETKNIGKVAAKEGSLTKVFYKPFAALGACDESGQVTKYFSVAPLGPGKSQFDSVKLSCGKCYDKGVGDISEYQVWAASDMYDSVKESDETDNRMTRTVSCFWRG